jgi:hypothetical protein
MFRRSRGFEGRLLSIESYYLVKEIIWFLHSLFESILFLSLALFLCYKIQSLLNKSGKSRPFCLVPDFKISSVFSHFVWYWLVTYNFHDLEVLPSIPSLFGTWILKGFWILSGLFMPPLTWSCDIFLDCIHLLLYACSIICISLEWNQFYHAVWTFWRVNSVCKYFIENFYVYVHFERLTYNVPCSKLLCPESGKRCCGSPKGVCAAVAGARLAWGRRVGLVEPEAALGAAGRTMPSGWPSRARVRRCLRCGCSWWE